MPRGNTKYLKANKRLVNKQKKETLSSTKENNLNSEQNKNYQGALTPTVKVEKTALEKICDFFSEWSGVLTAISLLIGFVLWASFLSYDINTANSDIEKLKQSNELSKDKIVASEKKQIALGKDIEYFRQDNQQIKKDISKIESVIYYSIQSKNNNPEQIVPKSLQKVSKIQIKK
mgnify:CR=1 FL=1